MSNIENKSPEKRGNPAWKKGGPSPNPGGRPKEVIEFTRKRRMKWLKELDRIAMQPDVKLIKDPDTGDTIDFEPAKDSDKINALRELNKIADIYPSEKTEVKMDIETDATKNVATEDVVRQALQEVLNKRGK